MCYVNSLRFYSSDRLRLGMNMSNTSSFMFNGIKVISAEVLEGEDWHTVSEARPAASLFLPESWYRVSQALIPLVESDSDN